MKDYSKTMFECAQADLDIAEASKTERPNLAAFHAQQCVEKALKGLLYEYCEQQNYESLGKQIGHDSIKAAMGIVGQTLKRVVGNSAFQKELRENMKSAQKKKKEGWESKWLISYALSRHLSDVLDLFNVEFTWLNSEQDFWQLSFDENPSSIRLERDWWEKFERVSKNNELILSIFVSLLGIHEGQELIKMRGKTPTEISKNFNNLLELMEQKMGDRKALIFTELQKSAQFMLASNRFAEWIKLVHQWAPLLDAHAIRGRYPSPNDMIIYRKNGRAVSRFVEKAKEIFDQTHSLATNLPV